MIFSNESGRLDLNTAFPAEVAGEVMDPKANTPRKFWISFGGYVELPGFIYVLQIIAVKETARLTWWKENNVFQRLMGWTSQCSLWDVHSMAPHGTSNLWLFCSSSMFSSSPLETPVVQAVGPVDMDGFDSAFALGDHDDDASPFFDMTRLTPKIKRHIVGMRDSTQEQEISLRFRKLGTLTLPQCFEGCGEHPQIVLKNWGTSTRKRERKNILKLT